MMSKAAEEYELQLFGFTISELQQSQRDVIAHRSTELVRQLVDSICENTPELTAEQAADYRSAIADVAANIINTKAPQLDRIDRHIGTTFSIPADVVLPEHQILAKHDITADEEHKLAEKLMQFEQQFRQQAQFVSALDAELRLHEADEERLLQECEIMERVERSLKEESASTAECRQAVEQLKGLCQGD